MKLTLFNTPKEQDRSKKIPEGWSSATDYPSQIEINPTNIEGRPSENVNFAVQKEPPEAHTSLVNSETYLQTQILSRLFLVTILSGCIVLVSTLPSLIQDSRWLVLSILSLTLGCLIIAAFFRRMAFPLRATVLLIGLLVLGLSSLLTDWLQEPGIIFLLALPFFAALITSKRGRISSLVVSIGAVCLVSGLITVGRFPQVDLHLGSSYQSLTSSIILIATFTLLAIGGTVSAGLLLGGYRKSLDREQIQTVEIANERTLLEREIQGRTDELHRRLVQIRTVAEINRAISRLLDIEQLLPEVCKLVSQRFNIYYVGIFLIEESANKLSESQSLLGNNTGSSENLQQSLSPLPDYRAKNIRQKNHTYAILKAGSGEAGRQMLQEGHKLEVGGDSMIGWATANHKPRIAQNVGQEVMRFNNPHLPLTRSELALPILVHEGSAAENSWDTDGVGERILGAMTIQSSEDSAFDQDDIVILQGIADGLAAAIENSRLFAATEANLEEIRTLHSQYLEQAWRQETELRGEIEYSFGEGGMPLSHMPTDNVLEIPIRLRDQVIGSLTVESSESADPGEPNKPGWSSDELSLIEAVTNQAALALENARLLEETRRKASLERIATSITSKMWASGNIDAILRTALQELSNSLGAREGWIELCPDQVDNQPPEVLVNHQIVTERQTETQNMFGRDNHG